MATDIEAAYRAHLAANAADPPTEPQKAARAAAAPQPDISVEAIGVALNEMVTDLVPTGSLE